MIVLGIIIIVIGNLTWINGKVGSDRKVLWIGRLVTAAGYGLVIYDMVRILKTH